MTTRHHLKTDPKYFEMVWENFKKFEIRKNDRDFQAGDFLILEEYDPEQQIYSGRKIEVVITYLLEGGQFGLSSDYCALSIMLITRISADRNHKYFNSGVNSLS